MKALAPCALLAACALALAPSAGASQRHPSQQELESEIICPVCPGETLDQSDAPLARRMKAFIRTRRAAGDTKGEIEAKLVDQFGPGVLATPPRHGIDLLVWLLPLVGVIAGAVVVGWLVWRWSRRREPGAPPAVASGANGRPGIEPELEARLEEELARFEG